MKNTSVFNGCGVIQPFELSLGKCRGERKIFGPLPPGFSRRIEEAQPISCRSMAEAAALPAPMARITVAAPETASPPA